MTEKSSCRVSSLFGSWHDGGRLGVAAPVIRVRIKEPGAIFAVRGRGGRYAALLACIARRARDNGP
jgi:hypothetical protein